jgi:hypothetical protein
MVASTYPITTEINSVTKEPTMASFIVIKNTIPNPSMVIIINEFQRVRLCIVCKRAVEGELMVSLFATSNMASKRGKGPIMVIAIRVANQRSIQPVPQPQVVNTKYKPGNNIKSTLMGISPFVFTATFAHVRIDCVFFAKRMESKAVRAMATPINITMSQICGETTWGYKT